MCCLLDQCCSSSPPHSLNSEDLSGSAVPENFELATERRARERREFEMRLAELEAEKARLQEAARRDEEEREREELARLREEMVSGAWLWGLVGRTLVGMHIGRTPQGMKLRQLTLNPRPCVRPLSRDQNPVGVK